MILAGEKLSGRPTSTHTCGVRPLRIVLQHPGQAEVRHFALHVVVDEDVAGSQVSVDVAHLCQVLHARSNATQHTNQLDGCELAVVQLRRGQNQFSLRMSGTTVCFSVLREACFGVGLSDSY